tara:strand:- start:56 stop:235 length:180 start_codon:yes stop_codon:yes gene_type:complete
MSWEDILKEEMTEEERKRYMKKLAETSAAFERYKKELAGTPEAFKPGESLEDHQKRFGY